MSPSKENSSLPKRPLLSLSTPTQLTEEELDSQIKQMPQQFDVNNSYISSPLDTVNKRKQHQGVYGQGYGGYITSNFVIVGDCLARPQGSTTAANYFKHFRTNLGNTLLSQANSEEGFVERTGTKQAGLLAVSLPDNRIFYAKFGQMMLVVLEDGVETYRSAAGDDDEFVSEVISVNPGSLILVLHSGLAGLIELLDFKKECPKMDYSCYSDLLSQS